MKKVLLLTLVMMLGASLASAQPGLIGAYADAGGTLCNIVDAGPGLLSVYLVHTLTGGATASEFMAPQPACLIGPLIGEVVNGAGVGASFTTGKSVGYGVCAVGAYHVGTLNFFGSGASTTCCPFPILPHPVNGLNMVDCTGPPGAKFPAGSVTNTINGDATCLCGVPTQNATWGAVKSLYVGE